MRRTLTIVFILQVVACGSAFAQLDPDPDSFGVYFDMDATVRCSEDPAMGYYDAYVMITNPSAAAGVAGLEFRLTTLVDGVENIPSLTFAADGLSPLTPPDYAWGFGESLPSAPVVHIATHSGTTFGNNILYYVGPIESATPSVAESIVYVDAADAGNKIVMGTPFGSFDLPVASHGSHDACGLPTGEETWGGVKRLYR